MNEYDFETLIEDICFTVNECHDEEKGIDFTKLERMLESHLAFLINEDDDEEE